ncbi:MAG: hypothetical protein ABI760_17130 [Ferruginibacter sp.]
MRKNSIKSLLFLFLPGVLIMGCYKNETRYFDDAADPGIVIFSDNGNNILSCFIEGKPWRTVSRITSGFPSLHTNFEVDIIKQPATGLRDTLIIKWLGYFSGNENSQGYLSLHLAVPPNFSYRDLSALQGQRLHIDATKGFFSTSITGLNTGNTNGSGDIYFHTAQFDSIAPGSYSGSISGLFEADFNSFKITRGRFDHIITPEQVFF